MFFDTLAKLNNLVHASQTIILNLSDGVPVGSEIFSLKTFAKNLKAFLVEPVDGSIKIEQAREVIDICLTKQTSDRFFIFYRAETMTRETSNSLLKLLEEPLENYHFILITTNPGAILQTIRSRAVLYAPKVENPLEQPPMSPEDVKTLARTLLISKSLPEIQKVLDVITKKKEDVRREYALNVLETAIEMTEKSYFKTKNPLFTTKLKGLIAAQAGVKQNGNLKLQIAANLI